MATDRLIIFDTTLRDGEQAPGFSMNTDEKLLLARQIDALGADIIEAGFPIASDDDARAVKLIAEEIRRPVIASLARCNPGDIERAGESLRPAARPRLHTFLATSDLHLECKLRMSREECLRAISAGVTQAGDYHGRHRVLGRGCDAQRYGLPLPGRRDRNRRRGDDDQPPRHGRVSRPQGDRGVLHRSDPQDGRHAPPRSTRRCLCARAGCSPS